MELNIKINLDNAAFEYDREAELKMIMLKMFNKMFSGAENAFIFDSNGNKVGEWRITEQEEPKEVLTNCPVCDAYLTVCANYELKKTR